MGRARSLLYPVSGIAALLLAWHLAAARTGAEALFPGPADVALAVSALAAEGKLVPYLRDSLLRFGAGYLAAVAAGLPLGLLLGISMRASRTLDPLVQILRPVSPIAWFPLFTLWFGIGELPAIVIVFVAAFFPVLLSTTAAVRSVDSSYLKVARSFGDGGAGRLLRVVIPAAMPRAVVGMRIAVGSAWVFLVAGEMLGVRSGLGFLVVDARNSLRTDLVLAAIVLIGLAGLLVDRGVGLVERRVKRAWGAS